MNTQWGAIAQSLWLDTSRIPTPEPKALQSQIYSPLAASHFASHDLLALESLQILERYLWPTFTEQASNHHVILIAAFVNIKRHNHLAAWSIFNDQDERFRELFDRILSLNLDASLPSPIRLVLLGFVTGAFQSLEKSFIRKECAPLVSISIWHNLHNESVRDSEVKKNTTRAKSWRAAQKRFESGTSDHKVRLQFERSWLYSMCLDYLRRLTITESKSENIAYCARFLEFLIDLISQLPTRRYTIVLLKNLNVLPILNISALSKIDDSMLLHDLTQLYRHFSEFPVDDTGHNNSIHSSRDAHYERLLQLQREALRHHEPKLKVLGLSNFASIDKASDLESHLEALTDIELEGICQNLGFRVSYPVSAGIGSGRALFLQILITEFSRPTESRSKIKDLSISPTDASLYDPVLLRNENYSESRPLALPKLNLQYLSLDDFMWRSFQLHQAEAFFEIRTDMESIVRRVKPRVARGGAGVVFEGFSKMALPIEKPAVIDVGLPRVGFTAPSFVRAEVILDLGRVNDRLRSEWDNLRSRDVIFLLAVQAASASPSARKGTSDLARPAIQHLRTAEVVQILDINGKSLRGDGSHEAASRSRKRRLLLDIDSVAFQRDQQQLSRTKTDIWSSINVIARRQGRENNFKPVLETIHKLVNTRTELPSWLQEVFLGYGDAKSASYPYMLNKIATVDFCDTFLDWSHLQASFPTKKLESDGELDPPFVLHFPAESPSSAIQSSKKRSRDQMDFEDASAQSVRVSTYRSVSNGPYPVDVPRRNCIKFTSQQVKAIASGVQPGLSVIVGPPGTGKTDVATQIINLLYHNFPSERILLVAHSNQALNQLFQKIIALDIDSRHLLRLGHGEEELEIEASYSKAGRVESFMDNRNNYLDEVNRLASSIRAEGAHGNSCETAGYFNQVFIQPVWSKFWSAAIAESATAQSIASSFPFTKYFSNAPVPELIPLSTVEDARNAAAGCKLHLDKIFLELEAIRPFEILRNPRDQANYLLIKEARIIAMTSTHAAMRRSEIADLGFHYQTLIMEEAAQITEIESFISCVLQNPDLKTKSLPLKRVVLVGDHLQNSPIVQNLALRQYANYEQSLFLRLVRQGVPAIHLDQQGRCRPSIAELFSWRYNGLTNLPHLSSSPEFSRANAGFRYEFQFIDVADYQGYGEREPTAHFIQNLGEAEYAVALFQYMRLLGYPASSISILTTYAGQRALIRDVLDHRCKTNRLFGLPRIVTTVDKYQGDQNDYVILSLVRTKSIGYVRDVRRLTVALSRARLGLYILGRRELFDNCLEMGPALKELAPNGDKLQLAIGEMFPTQRCVGEEVANVAEMEGTEHLGQYVYEMTQAKVKSLGGTLEVLDGNGDAGGEPMVHEAVAEDGEDLGIEDDPLHERVL